MTHPNEYSLRRAIRIENECFRASICVFRSIVLRIWKVADLRSQGAASGAILVFIPTPRTVTSCQRPCYELPPMHSRQSDPHRCRRGPCRALVTQRRRARPRRRSRGSRTRMDSRIRPADALDPDRIRRHGAPWTTVYQVIRILARADSALAHVFGFHHLQLAGIRLYGSAHSNAACSAPLSTTACSGAMPSIRWTSAPPPPPRATATSSMASRASVPARLGRTG